MRLLLFSLLFITTLNARLHRLKPNRKLKWDIAKNPNQGPMKAQPEQIHLSYGGSPSTMFVTWLAFDDTGNGFVEWGEGRAMDRKSTAHVYLFQDGQSGSVDRYIFRAVLTGIEPGKTYRYHVGSQFGWSAIYEFTGLKERSEGGFKMAVFGDMGSQNARSLGKIQEMVQKGDVDMVLHVGDMAYDMNENNSEMGDEFMRQIEPAAAYIPYMTAVGNHENNRNFTQYVNRFTMPGTENGLMYSFDLGLVHYIVISTEFYFFTSWGWEQIGNQWRWLSEDLEKANDNRHNVPWIITMGHRPMYCSDFDGDDCTKYESIIRNGLPETHAYGLEKLFYKHGVDIELWAHEHSYERMFPVYNRTVYNGTDSPYVDPPAPVHVVTGSAVSVRRIYCHQKQITFDYEISMRQ
ncbi:unnamed protein product, partial [Mesorhabditis belari]|uniref:Purple acid phosphatase n=1 Tax=Mesorhabditis belari TaxID=2138241 RepID=A0AAF3EW84_9BILA